VYRDEFTHSYPYDWRTKQPVLLRASRQWFIDTNQLKERAIQAVQDVKIRPESAANAFLVSDPLRFLELLWIRLCGSGHIPTPFESLYINFFSFLL
jgi:hypothetical protein